MGVDLDYEIEQVKTIKQSMNNLSDMIQRMYPTVYVKSKDAERVLVDTIMTALAYRDVPMQNESGKYPMLLGLVSKADLYMPGMRENIEYKLGGPMQESDWLQVHSAMMDELRYIGRSMRSYRSKPIRVSKRSSRDSVSLMARGERVYVRQPIYDKMIGQYGQQSEEADKLIFAINYRYELYGMSKSGMCLAASRVYEPYIGSTSTLELFANPMNSHLPQYCSLFPELEGPFGSIGSAFIFESDPELFDQFKTVVANPPYVNSIMERMAQMILNAPRHLRFIITIPDWRSGAGSYPVYEMLRPVITSMIVESGEYEYVDNFSGKLIKACRGGTLVIEVNYAAA